MKLEVIEVINTPRRVSYLFDTSVEKALSILGLENVEYTNPELKTAYRTTLMNVHPDTNPSDDLANERTKAVIEAYDLLTKRQYRADNLAYNTEIQLGFGRILIGMTNYGDTVTCLRASKDGDQAYVGTYSGKLYLLSGFEDMKEPLVSVSEPIREIVDTGQILLLRTYESIFLVKDKQVSKRIGLDTISPRVIASDDGWMLITSKTSVSLYTFQGILTVTINFRDNVAEMFWANNELRAYTGRKTYVFSVSIPTHMHEYDKLLS